jgi:uncharacterized protein YyaL (SSP411 family)
MAAGGIYDHLGGGFARYSVDGRWLVPHFEKMLYDNALLAGSTCTAGRSPARTGSGRSPETVGYVLRDLRHAGRWLLSPRTPTARARRAGSTSGPARSTASRGSELTRSIPDRFTDPAGGFFTSGDDAEQLVKRPKDQMDNPLPSGNSLAAEALVHLSLLTGDEGLRSLAEGTIRAGSPMIERYPSAVGHLLSVLHTLHRGPKEVAVTGPDARLLAATIWRRFRPHVALALDETGDSAPIVPLLSGRWRAGRTLAHVCERFACELPVDRDEDLARLLG